jgi:hypothetical protein
MEHNTGLSLHVDLTLHEERELYQLYFSEWLGYCYKFHATTRLRHKGVKAGDGGGNCS